MYHLIFKRIFDFVVAFILLVLCLPIFLLIAVMIKIFLGSPIVFTQIRPGFKEKPFKLYKFRTMLDTTDKYQKLLSDEQRLTKFGRFLRNSSLDELPELINILKGEMSLVGPRPLLMQYLPRYTSEQARRHLVKPGLTGWAQINGRNNLSWENKFKLDIWYVDHINFKLDIKILWLTFFKVVKRQDIHANGFTTMPEFQGCSEKFSNTNNQRDKQ